LWVKTDQTIFTVLLTIAPVATREGFTYLTYDLIYLVGPAEYHNP
jgi:hypothetical protein